MNGSETVATKTGASSLKPDGPDPASLAVESLDGREPIGILLVDDEPKNLTVLESILADPQYKLVRAETVDQALLALIEDEFALIVLDIQMPGMSGFELASMIKQRRKTADLPIIFLTAHYSQDQHILEGYGTGAVDYLHKPVNSTILRSKVAVFAELYRKNRENLQANRALLNEIAERRHVQSQLQRLNNELEARVNERTFALSGTNEALRESERRLAAANQLKDQFLAMLGHELRNPLAPIRNVVSILREGGADAKHLKWCCDVLDRQAEQLARIVNDLLDVSRVSQGKIQLERKCLDLSIAIRQAIETARPLIDIRRQTLTVRLPDHPVWVHGDRTRLAQVIGNLLNNAAKYTDEGGLIWLELDAQAGPAAEAVIRVRDNGRGFDPKAADSLFELFYQADTNIDRAAGGMGIGLALVRNLVQLHGGSVEASSLGADQGSEFTVRLPCLSQEVAQSDAAPISESTPPYSARILVVDDNRDSARSMSFLLELRGHKVSIATDGYSAVEYAVRDRPEMVIMDIGLPGINGYDACRLMRQGGLERQLIVAMTGYGQSQDRQQSLEAGFDEHLVKPVDILVIQQVLDDYLARQRAE